MTRGTIGGIRAPGGKLVGGPRGPLSVCTDRELSLAHIITWRGGRVEIPHPPNDWEMVHRGQAESKSC